MKAIVIDNDIDHSLMVADSAIGRDVAPLFLPDGEWTGCLLPAYRIGRLGKGIAPKFARRYIDACGIVLLIRPQGADQAPCWLSYMDSAITTGRFVAEAADATMEYAGLRGSAAMPPMQDVAEALARVSAVATLRTGDLIIPSSTPLMAMELRPDTRISACIGAEQVLSLKVK